MSFEVKTCSKCSQSKSTSEFEFQRRACKVCRYEARNLRGRPKYSKLNTGLKICCRCKKRKLRIEFHQSLYELDGCRSHCNACSSVRTKKDYEINKEIVKEKRRQHYALLKQDPEKKAQHRLTRRKYQNKKTKEDLFYKLTRRLRNRLYYALKNKTWKKNTHFTEYIGCSPQELVAHIEAQFQPGMTWDNYGFWHLDHKIPLVSAISPEELYKLCHHTNLQPLWAPDNLRKSAQLVKP